MKLQGARQAELLILDVKSPLYPHRLVVGLYGEYLASVIVYSLIVVEVCGAKEQRQLILIHHIRGVGEEEVGVCLEVNHSPINQEATIALKEVGGSEALTRILHLGVREGEPYLLHLAVAEETVNHLDVGAKESHILQSLLQSLSGTSPHPGSLDVHTYEVDMRKQFGKLHCIFALATSQLEHYGVGVMKILLSPTALHLKRHVVDNTIWILEHILIAFHISKLSEFSLSH